MDPTTPKTALAGTGLLALGLALLTAGCMGTHAVHQATLTDEDVLAAGMVGPRQVAGVPFYVKRPVVLQETVRALHCVRLGVELKAAFEDGDGPPLGASRTADYCGEKASAADRVQEALEPLIGQTIPLADFKDAVRELDQDAPAPGDYLDPARYTGAVVANRRVTEMRVDPTHVFYINGRRPWFGSGSGTFKLNGDQMLTEATASGTGPALADLPGVFPALDLFSELFGVDAADDDKGLDATEAPRLVKVTGKVSRSPVTHLLVTRCSLPAGDHRLDEPLQPGQDCLAGGRPEYEFRAAGGSEAPKEPDPAFTATAEIFPAEE